MTLPHVSRIVAVLLVAGPQGQAAAASAPPPGRMPVAPPPPPPVETAQPARDGRHLPAGTAVVYSIGEPTDEEQLYVEFINRARANPRAEAVRLAETDDPAVLSSIEYFGVNLRALVEQFAGVQPAAPLSIEPRLTAAARAHSQDMFENVFQSHDGSNGSKSGERVSAAGYPWTVFAENVYASARSVWHGHAGFEIDWGFSAFGMQVPPGHRQAIHSALFREVGIGVVLGVNEKPGGAMERVGPQVVTQVFGNRSGLTPFITGVVFYDFNGNEFYDLGEGIGGVEISADGTPFRAVSARSGGYSLPVPGDGTYDVRFRVAGLPEASATVIVSNAANVKLDHRPPYTAPMPEGDATVQVGQPGRYAFSPVGGATGYEWRFMRAEPWDIPEGAESAPGRFEADTTGDYDPVNSEVVHSGAAAYHLAHPQPARDQLLAMRRPLWLGPHPELRFQSRLGVATDRQVARVEISDDGGMHWTGVWSQTGAGQPGEETFSLRTVSLGDYAGRVVLLRFVYAFRSGEYYPQTAAGVGWHLDEIHVADALELFDPVVSQVAGTEFSFEPAAPGLYVLQARALLGDRTLAWGPPLEVAATDEPSGDPEIRIQVTRGTGQPPAGILFEIQTAGNVSGLELESAPDPDGPWTAANIELVPVENRPGTFRAQLDPSEAPVRFFRVRSP